MGQHDIRHQSLNWCPTWSDIGRWVFFPGRRTDFLPGKRKPNPPKRRAESCGASPAAPLSGIRQREQVQTGEQEQGEREHR